MLSSGCYVGMENRDPRDRRPVPLPYRWPYDCTRERLGKECLDTRRTGSQGFDRGMVVAEPRGARLAKQQVLGLGGQRQFGHAP